MNSITQSSLAVLLMVLSQMSWALPAEAIDDALGGDEDTGGDVLYEAKCKSASTFSIFPTFLRSSKICLILC